MDASKPCSASNHPFFFHSFVSTTDIQKHCLGLASGHTRLELWQFVFSFLFFITVSLVSCFQGSVLPPYFHSCGLHQILEWAQLSFFLCALKLYLLAHPSTMCQPLRPRTPFYPKSPVVAPVRYSGVWTTMSFLTFITVPP